MTARANRDPYAEGLRLSAAKRHYEAIECFEEALAQKPNDTRTLFALGNTATALGMARPAEAFFRQVLAIEPGRLEATVNLANLLRAEAQFDAAEALLAPALARLPTAPELWLTLGSLLREKGDDVQAAAHYRQALKLKPDYVPALGNLADVLADEGAIEDALALYDHVVACEPQNAQARLNRAVLHLLTGNLNDGWKDYAARIGVAGKVPVADQDMASWMGGTLKNTRLLVRTEQGIGDQIMFASLLPELARHAEGEEALVLIECDARLVPLFARSFPTVDVHACRIASQGGTLTAHYDWLAAAGGADMVVLMGTLPRWMRRDPAQFPRPHRYLQPDAAETNVWRERLRSSDRGPRIGICWRSGARGGARAVQYAPLQAWAQFLRELPGPIVSAQYDATQEELYELEKLSGRQIMLPKNLDQKNELDRTCAMLSTLDAVVSAPTAVSWLSAAAGVPTAKILYDTSWTSFGERFEPFAPSAELMMPKRRGDWTDAFAQAARWITALPSRA